MTREEKANMIESLTEKISQYSNVYIADTSSLSVEKINALRRICFDKGIHMQVAKNTLIKKAMEKIGGGYEPLFEILHGTSALMLSEQSNLPAKVIKDFRKKDERPIIKGAFIDSAIFIGDHQIDNLATLKSKEELVGEIISLLQSPARNVISALQSGGGKLAGILKTLSEKEVN